jgi:hypothetical protein
MSRTGFGADVLAFAAEQGVTDFLQPILDMTRRVFPENRRIQAVLQDDPELPGDQHMVFEVQVGAMDVDRSVERHWQWSRDLFQICPATHACLFGLHVDVENS